MQHYTVVDRIALGLAAASMLVGVVVLGLIETLAGQPYGAVPMTDEAGAVIATPAIDPNLRTGLVLAGIALLFLWGLYRIVQPAPGADRPHTVETPAD